MELHALFKPKDVKDVLGKMERGEPLMGKKNPLPLAEPKRTEEPAGTAGTPKGLLPAGQKPPGMFVMVKVSPFFPPNAILPQNDCVTQDLFDAIEEGDISKAQQAIAGGADIQSSHMLWHRGHGPAPTIRSLGEIVTPLEFARQNKQPEIAKLLESAGAKG